MKIYTKTGDKGYTSIYRGKRLKKSDPHVNAYGTIDELSTFIGLILTEKVKTVDKELLTDVQRNLYGIMALLNYAEVPWLSIQEHIAHLEERIDSIEKEKPTPHFFVLPQGSTISVYMHICRTITRRAEREVVYFLTQRKHKIQRNDAQDMIQYLNRLSDLFFALARLYNKKKTLKA